MNWKKQGNFILIVAIYVDVLIFTSNNGNTVTELRKT